MSLGEPGLVRVWWEQFCCVSCGKELELVWESMEELLQGRNRNFQSCGHGDSLELLPAPIPGSGRCGLPSGESLKNSKGFVAGAPP